MKIICKIKNVAIYLQQLRRQRHLFWLDIIKSGTYRELWRAARSLTCPINFGTSVLDRQITECHVLPYRVFLFRGS
jgi:hypothetical protein